jgi:hypothetical protein
MKLAQLFAERQARQGKYWAMYLNMAVLNRVLSGIVRLQ